MDEALPISKTQRKQAMQELQHLGEALVKLSVDQLQAIDLPEPLLQAILEAKRLTKFGAIRRQMQYIGRLMREAEPEPIRQQLAYLQGTSKQHIAWEHLLENWRERLLADEAAFTLFAEAYPQADLTQLRTLIRNTHKEQQANKPPKHYRLLFQALREFIPLPSH